MAALLFLISFISCSCNPTGKKIDKENIDSLCMVIGSMDTLINMLPEANTFSGAKYYKINPKNELIVNSMKLGHWNALQPIKIYNSHLFDKFNYSEAILFFHNVDFLLQNHVHGAGQTFMFWQCTYDYYFDEILWNNTNSVVRIYSPSDTCGKVFRFTFDIIDRASYLILFVESDSCRRYAKYAPIEN